MQKEVAPLPGPAPDEAGGVGARGQGRASRAIRGHIHFLFKEESISFQWGKAGGESLSGSVWNKWLFPWRQRACPKPLAFQSMHLVVVQGGCWGWEETQVINGNNDDWLPLKLSPQTPAYTIEQQQLSMGALLFNLISFLHYSSLPMLFCIDSRCKGAFLNMAVTPYS